MANKYLISGAAFYGDGTSSAEATVAGGVGAWNNINVMLGTIPTYGTLASGDTIYVRSKTAAGAAVYSAANSLSVGPPAGITGTTWVVDNGVTWPGIDGTVTFAATTTTDPVYVRDQNTLIALSNRALKVVNSRSDYNNPVYVTNVLAKQVEFGFTSKTSAAYTGAVVVHGSVLTDCTFTFLALPGNIASYTAGFKSILINPTVLLNSTAGLSQANGIFSATVGSSMEIYGGTVSGVGATASQALFYAGSSPGSSAEYLVVGLSAPNEMPLVSAGAEGSPMFNLRMLAADKKASASVGASWGYADSRNDGNYPVLSAVLPDTANTGWSWKLKAAYPTTYRPAKLLMSKMYTDASAAKTLTLEALISSSIAASANKSNVYMLVQYVDATTGNFVIQTTQGAGALDASPGANWSATTYGAATLNKIKLALTTSGSIKRDTLVNVVLFITLAASMVNDIYFIDPDPALT